LRYLLAYDSSLVTEVLGAFVDATFQSLRGKARESAREERDEPGVRQAGYGFNLFAGQGTHAGDRVGLERLARYILRPPLSQRSVELTSQGRVVLHLKRAWRDGTTAMIFDPVDFISKLVALIPRPRANVLRFHGVYAPHARLRARVVPESQPPPQDRPCDGCADSPKRQDHRLAWAELLARVFSVDVYSCPRCGSRMSRIAWITDSEAIKRILRAVGLTADSPEFRPAKSVEELFGEVVVA